MPTEDCLENKNYNAMAAVQAVGYVGPACLLVCWHRACKKQTRPIHVRMRALVICTRLRA